MNIDLKKGIARVEVENLEISKEYDEDEEWWYAYRVSGGINDREWTPVARASEFFALLQLLGHEIVEIPPSGVTGEKEAR